MRYTDKERLEYLLFMKRLSRNQVDKMIDLHRFDVKSVLKKKGLKQNEAAKRIGVSGSTMSLLVNKLRTPTPEMRDAINAL